MSQNRAIVESITTHKWAFPARKQWMRVMLLVYIQTKARTYVMNLSKMAL